MFLLREERPITRLSTNSKPFERFENDSSWRTPFGIRQFRNVFEIHRSHRGRGWFLFSLVCSQEFSTTVQKTGPINARLPNIAKTRESNPLENLRTAPRCGGGGRGKPRREREATRVGRSKIALVARSVGAETGGVASLRPWQIAIYEQWASIVKKRHVTSAVFAVRALCFPLPLCFHPFSEGKEREARPLLFQHDSSLLFSRLHLAPSRNWLFAAIILPEWSHAGREGEREREWSGVTRTMRWLERSAGNDAVTRSRERRGASKGLEMAENSTQMPSAPVGKVFEKRAEFHRLGPSGVAQTKEIVALFECFLREPRNRSLEYFLRFGLFDSLFLWKISLP